MAVKPYARWSADTEQAFLLALRLTGQVRLAAAEIGRATASAYKRRSRDPAFAARWDAVLDEHQAKWRAAAAEARAEPPPPRLGRERHDGWTAVRRRAFLRALSETGDVREACQRVRISSTAAYRLRRDHPSFARDWDAALDRAGPMIEQIAWERAVEGWDEPVVAGGVLVGTRRRYSDTLLRLLLTREDRARGTAPGAARGPAELTRLAHEAARAAGGQFHMPVDREKLLAEFHRRIAGVSRHASLHADGGSDD